MIQAANDYFKQQFEPEMTQKEYLLSIPTMDEFGKIKKYTSLQKELPFAIKMENPTCTIYRLMTKDTCYQFRFYKNETVEFIENKHSDYTEDLEEDKVLGRRFKDFGMGNVFYNECEMKELFEEVENAMERLNKMTLEIGTQTILKMMQV